MRLSIGTCSGLGAVAVVLCGTVMAQDNATQNQAPPPEPDKVAVARELVDALAHRDPNVRQAAAAAIQGLDGESLRAAVGGLVAVIERGELPYAVVAGSALIELDLSSSPRRPVEDALIDSLYRLMQDRSLQPQRWAIAAQLVRNFAPETAADHPELWAETLANPDRFRAYEVISLIELVASRNAAAVRQAAIDRINARPKSDRTKTDTELRATLKSANQRRQSLVDVRAMLEPALFDILHRRSIDFTEIELDASVVPVGLVGYIRRLPAENRLLVLRTLSDLEADPTLLTSPLLQSMHTANQYVALEAATLIGDLPGHDNSVQSAKQQAVETLANLAVLPGGKVRGAAAGEIGGVGQAAIAVVPRLTAMLSDSDPDVRTGAARSLGDLGPAAEVAIPALQAAIRIEELVSKENTITMQEALKSIKPDDETTDAANSEE
ncbi:HEAT repeat domain-containing protein [Thalassoroseus pseudoceratinae]|uniref:HEAT repeat domain-containing protein n=1 Tax=Thalassoroseus pseudoceratinae TaxID=2713176 RepID=UPI001424355C|nr:HEAT repeat domain-containing protein [Thalassoroseus pseudoceratinae]